MVLLIVFIRLSANQAPRGYPRYRTGRVRPGVELTLESAVTRISPRRYRPPPGKRLIHRFHHRDLHQVGQPGRDPDLLSPPIWWINWCMAGKRRTRGGCPRASDHAAPVRRDALGHGRMT